MCRRQARQKLEELDGRVKVEHRQQDKLKNEMNGLNEALEMIEKFSNRKKFENRYDEKVVSISMVNSTRD